MKGTIKAFDGMSESQIVDAAKQKKPQSQDSANGNGSESTDKGGAARAKDSQDEPDGSGDRSGQPGVLQLTEEQLQQVVGAAVDQVVGDLRDENKALKTQLDEAQRNRESLERVFSTLGKTAPGINTKLASARDRVDGLCSDFLQALESAPRKVWVNPTTGDRHIQRDMSRARRIFFTQRDRLRDEMEEYAHRHGLLQGGYTATEAPTARTDVPPAFLDYLSMVIRETHSARYVYWQFPFYRLELGKGPGDSIQVARFRWLPEAGAIADRVLTPGTNLDATSQNIAAGAVTIQLDECGLGKNATYPPVAVPEFLIAYSILDLENAVVTRLGHDYESWEDLSIRARYFATTRVVYNDNGGITVTPGDVGAGDDGTLTENFLNNLYAYMSGLRIPPLDDGSYILVVHDTALAQFKNSMGEKFRYTDRMAAEELTNLLQAASNRMMGKTSGYVGKYCGFQIFATNAHSMGAAGTEGAQTETIGTGAVTTRSSFAFGRAAVARALGMEAELRRDNNDDFGRLNRWVWLSHEKTDYLDVDPAIAAEQQLRVVEIRTIDVPV